MKVIQINVLAKERSTGRTTDELHNFLIKNNHESYVAYGIGAKINDSHYYKISNTLDYYHHNILARIFGSQGFHSKIATKKLIKWMNKIKPDVVHLRNLHSNYINLNILFKFLKSNNIATVITTHDFWFLTAFCPYPLDNCDICKCDECKKFKHHPTCFFNPKKEFKRKISVFTSLSNFGIQANSLFSKSIVDKSLLKNYPCKVIYNWIDRENFYPDFDSSIYKNNGKPVVLAIWSFLDDNSERFKFFVKIANLLYKKYYFVMVGNFTFSPSKYPNINFIQGTNNINLLRKYYSSANVLFNPSISDTFGKVNAESISCGTPCVVFNNQALPEIVGKNECGIVVEPFNVDESIKALDFVLSKNKDFYKNKCIERSKKLFDMNTNCNKLVDFYLELIKNGK